MFKRLRQKALKSSLRSIVIQVFEPYKIVFDTSLGESIEALSKSELIDSESQRGVFTEPRVIVHALIELDLSSSLKHLVNIASADFETQ